MAGNDNNKSNAVLKYAGLATQWLIVLGLAVWGGLKLDGLIAWKFPVLTIVLPLVALGFLFWQLLKSLNNKDT